MDMSGMDMSGASGMGYMMNVTFYSSTMTPLYSMMWTPTGMGSYAGTCIFLIILGVVFRVLTAVKAVLEQRWTDTERDRRIILIKGKPVEPDSQSVSGTLVTTKGEREEVRVLKARHHHVAPWRLSVDLPRATLTLVTSGVGYLLMLAVMTLNVGYFLSVLGGIFLGELISGRYGAAIEH